ncbi:hypothetical protein EYC80_001044 [Monilinia laxa]|uniref:Uncharacterized protein n=1 Tax=Monilinia laxa TaxID=61186 RepID=A0A5N6K834_MONLA|nr:hypothetical protein EYC80_001044 [Monilinia laxa]
MNDTEFLSANHVLFISEFLSSGPTYPRSIGIRHHECMYLPTFHPSLNLVFIRPFIHPEDNHLIQIMHSCTSWKLIFLYAPRVHICVHCIPCSVGLW